MFFIKCVFMPRLCVWLVDSAVSHIVTKFCEMLEGPSLYMAGRKLPSLCKKWNCCDFLVIGPPDRKRHLDSGDKIEFQKSKKPLLCRGDNSSVVYGLVNVQADHSNNQPHCADDQSDSTSLIHQIGRDLSISCLVRCSRSDFDSIASLNQNFRTLVRSGELYRLRRQLGIVEQWVYYSSNLFEWEAFDPILRKWMKLPRMDVNECFMCSDKESLAVGTELLVFGKEIYSHVVYKYSVLTNSWSSGMITNTPRCLFGSASLGTIGIVAGGCDTQGRCLSSAELYDSESGTWTNLPSMHKPRKMCSGVFMDGKFYVIGGIGEDNINELNCGEEYDLEKRSWREIPNMFPLHNNGDGSSAPATSKAPPLLAVVKNELYAAYHARQELRKYDKERNLWITIGRLPENINSMNGWGLAFRACGDKLIVIGGPRAAFGGTIEINAWEPNDRPLQWDLLGSKHSSSFIYNCAIMGC